MQLGRLWTLIKTECRSVEQKDTTIFYSYRISNWLQAYSDMHEADELQSTSGPFAVIKSAFLAFIYGHWGVL